MKIKSHSRLWLWFLLIFSINQLIAIDFYWPIIDVIGYRLWLNGVVWFYRNVLLVEIYSQYARKKFRLAWSGAAWNPWVMMTFLLFTPVSKRWLHRVKEGVSAIRKCCGNLMVHNSVAFPLDGYDGKRVRWKWRYCFVFPQRFRWLKRVS